MSKKPQPIVCNGHSRPVVGVAFRNDPISGVDLLASASHDRRPMLRWGDTGDWIGTFIGHKGAVWSVDVDRDAKLVVTGSADFSAKIWNATDGSELLTLQGHKHIVKCVEFSTDGDRVVTGCSDKTTRIFDVETGLSSEFACPAQVRATKWIAPQTVVVGLSDGWVRSYDARSGSEIASFHAHDSSDASPKGVNDISGDVANDGVLAVAAGRGVAFVDQHLAETRSKHLFSVASKIKISSASLAPKTSGSKSRTFVCGGTDLWVHGFSYDEPCVSSLRVSWLQVEPSALTRLRLQAR